MNRTIANYLLVACLAALAAGGATFFALRHSVSSASRASAAQELALVRQAVARRLQETGGDVAEHLAAFARETAGDQLFSLRLLVENNRAANEVTGKAGQFMGPMGFSLLEICDSAGTILSSGHFPASAGTIAAKEKGARLSGGPAFLEDEIMGKRVMTFQAQQQFVIADSIRFCVRGGVVVDERFLERLSPLGRVRLLFKQGSAVTGMPGLRAISDVKNDTIIINDRRCPAVLLSLPYAGTGDVPSLIAFVND